MTFAKKVFLWIDKAFDKSQNPQERLDKYGDGLTMTKDISYADEDICKLNTYVLPREGAKYPVVFEIHGGGFSAGDKMYRECLCRFLAKETGAFVVNVNYGLGEDIVCPEPMRQLVKAFNWVIDHADELNLDTDRMVATGDSAGGYYSAMLSVTQDNDELQNLYGKMNGRFSGAVFNCGLYNLELALSKKIVFNMTSDVCKDFCGLPSEKISDFDLFPYVSPCNFITDKFPASLVIYAKKDIFCGGQGEKLVSDLTALGVHNESFGSTLMKDNHTFPLTWTSKPAKKANALIIDFLKRFFAREF